MARPTAIPGGCSSPGSQPLNQRGLAQAEEAARVLEGQLVARILASTMLRAQQTADAVAGVLGLPVAPDDGLRERWFGDWIGTSSAVIGWAGDPTNGEILADFVARVRASLAAALAAGDGSLLVAHGGVLMVVLGCLGIAWDWALFRNAQPLLLRHDGSDWTAAVVGAAPNQAAAIRRAG